MQLHANAALGLAGRRRLVVRIEQGHSIRAAAAALSVAPATAHRCGGPDASSAVHNVCGRCS
jgi:hypothetical protein